jgi:hypothetical protein
MTIAEFNKAMTAYEKSRKEYEKKMDKFSKQKTDCTGTKKAPFCK